MKAKRLLNLFYIERANVSVSRGLPVGPQIHALRFSDLRERVLGTGSCSFSAQFHRNPATERHLQEKMNKRRGWPMSLPATHSQYLMVSSVVMQSPPSQDSQKSLLMDGLMESGNAASHWLSNLRHGSCFLQLLISSCLNFPGMAFQLLHSWSTNLNPLPPAS